MVDVHLGLASLERARRVLVEGRKRVGDGLLICGRDGIRRWRYVEGVDGYL